MCALDGSATEEEEEENISTPEGHVVRVEV
jgi:hypothetical protein